MRGQEDWGGPLPRHPRAATTSSRTPQTPRVASGSAAGDGRRGGEDTRSGAGNTGDVRERGGSFGGSFGFVSQMMGNSWAGRALPQPPPGVSPPRGSQPPVARSSGTDSPSPASHAASLVLDTAPAPHPPGGRIRGLAELSQLREAERPRAGLGGCGRRGMGHGELRPTAAPHRRERAQGRRWGHVGSSNRAPRAVPGPLPVAMAAIRDFNGAS